MIVQEKNGNSKRNSQEIQLLVNAITKQQNPHSYTYLGSYLVVDSFSLIKTIICYGFSTDSDKVPSTCTVCIYSNVSDLKV